MARAREFESHRAPKKKSEVMEVYCQICNRYTDERCNRCSKYKEALNEEDVICIGGKCDYCDKYDKQSDLCRLIWEQVGVMKQKEV